MKFEIDFSLVSYLTTNKVAMGTWYVDSVVSHHIIEARELFSSLIELESGIHVDLDDDSKNAVKGKGPVLFQLNLGGPFDAQDVLYVPGLKKNLLSTSIMKDMGFFLIF